MDIERGKAILEKLLADDVIQIRPSDRERFMNEWREAMGLIEQASASGEVEPVGFIPSSGLNNLAAGHPAKVYPVEAMPSPFEPHKLIYAHPPAKVPDGWKEIIDRIVPDLSHEPDQSEYPAEWSLWADRQRVRKELALLTTPTPATKPETEWVIQLRGEYLATRGIWERPDHRGYTNDLHEAGRYSQEEAEKAEAMAPHKYKAVCLIAPATQEQ